MQRIKNILSKNKKKIRGQMKSDYMQEMHNVENEEKEIEMSN